eukprot:Em0001g746a
MSKATQFISDLRDDGIKISIAGDLWSDNGMALFGICGHGITSNWEMKTVLLAASPCGHERHTGEYIEAQTKTLLARVGIEYTPECVFKRVRDNGSNMVLAWDKDGAVPCFDHTLELSVKKFADELETTLSKVRGLVGHFNHSTIAKNALADIQKEMNKPQHVLDQDVKTRWRSTFKTCKILHENQAPVMFYDVRNARNAGDTYKLNKLSVDEWTEVEEIAGCLQVAADASQMMEGGKYATSGLVLPCIAKVIESVDPATKILFPERTVDGQVAVPTNSFQATVMRGRAAMLNDLTKRWIIELEPDLLDFYCVAALLDPRFKDFKFLQSKKLPSKKNILPAEWLTKATSRFKVEFDSLWSFEGAGVPGVGGVPELAKAISAEDCGSSFSKEHGISVECFFGDDADVIISQPNVSCKEDCDQYLSIPAISAKSDPLVWWQQNQDRFPHVAKMARQHLGVPATSASVERVFSGVGLTFSDLRQNMKDSTLESICWIKEGNKVKRFEWCQEHQQDNFSDVIWTDESSIQLETHRRTCCRKIGQPPKPKPRPKHPVHVWGAISLKGPAKLCIFDGIMDSPLYVNILETTLLPFLARKFPTSHRFMADNDPKHTSKLAQQFLNEKQVSWWRTPAESPDLNPIENLWHELKEYIRREVKPKNKDELIRGIKAFWRTVTPSVCAKYIGHLKKVIPKAIELKGDATGY